MATRFLGVDVVEEDDDVPVVKGGLRGARPPPIHAAKVIIDTGGPGDDLFDMLANPKKARSQYAEPVRSDSGPGKGMSDEFAFDDFGDEDDAFDDMMGGDGQERTPPMQQGPSREEVFREKSELLHKMHRMKERGFEVPQFDMRSDLDEMRFECSKIERAAECRNAVNMMRQILVAGTSAMQFLNNRYDPIGLKLDGWSESVMANIGDYDNVFERLYDKHRGKVAMAPELELIMMVGGSALMFHMTASFTRAGLPSMSEIAKQDPELMKSLLKVMMKNSMDGSQPPQSRPPPPAAASKSEPNAPKEPYVMRGPGFDMGGLMDGTRARAMAPSHSTLDSIVQESLGSNRPSEAVVVETIDGKDDESVTGSVMGDGDTRTIHMNGTPKKKRGGGSKKKKPEDASAIVLEI